MRADYPKQDFYNFSMASPQGLITPALSAPVKSNLGGGFLFKGFKMRLLDLFCGAGGASMGYHRAGFEIVGVDIKPQPHFPFEFIQADALSLPIDFISRFDAIHASPPCQFYSRLRHLPWLKGKKYWDSIPPTRDLLIKYDKPWILENVEDAPVPNSIILCGQMFGLSLYRHRRFEAPFLILQPTHESHRNIIVPGRASLGRRHHGQQGFREINRNSMVGKSGFAGDVDRRRLMMKIDWMSGSELGQAIPPIYTEFIGKQLLKYLESK